MKDEAEVIHLLEQVNAWVNGTVPKSFSAKDTQRLIKKTLPFRLPDLIEDYLRPVLEKLVEIEVDLVALQTENATLSCYV
jgi:hypothetical protein